MGESVIVIMATLRSKPGQGDAVAARVVPLVEARLAEEGVVSYQVCRSVSDPDEFRFVEVYRDGEALTEHVRVTRGDEHQMALAPLVEGPPVPEVLGLVAAGAKLGGEVVSA